MKDPAKIEYLLDSTSYNLQVNWGYRHNYHMLKNNTKLCTNSWHRRETQLIGPKKIRFQNVDLSFLSIYH